MKECLKKIRLFINKIGSKSRYSKLMIKNPTIISNNCYAGIIYEYLGCKYHSPTIGLLIYPKDYIKFCSKFDYYISQQMKFIKFEESHNKNEMIKRNQEKSIIGKLDDIEICFLHYKTETEALEKWNRRCKRINKNCTIFKFNDQNGCTLKQLKEFDMLNLNNKICFVSKDYKELSNAIYMKCDKNADEVQKDYYKSHRYFDIINFINDISKKDEANL